MKNEVFSGQRFWSYFKYDATQMWRNHMKAAVGIGLSGLIFYFLCIFFGLVVGDGWDGPNLATRFGVFMVAFTILELYQTRTYGYLTDRRKGSAWLLVPASAFEKWLSMMLMTLVVIPVVFLAVFFSVDSILSLADPTVGQSMISSIAGGMTVIKDEIMQVNGDYNTNWNLWAVLPSAILGFCCNFLFFLLCGLIFKRYKILGGFGIILGLSILLSLVSSLIVFGGGVEYEDFAQAEGAIRGVIHGVNWVIGLITAGLAGGIFWRIKTLKH